MKKEREGKKLLYNASEMREISEKSAPLKLEEYVEGIFDKVMRNILEAATNGKCKAVFWMDPFATNNDEVANRIETRCQNLGYTTIYHQDLEMMEFQW